MARGAYLITGATGFVGSHVADRCRRDGRAIVALVRPQSDVSHLESLGATIYRGELTDVALLKKAMDGVEVVIHCAAKVGDWGPVEEFRKANVDVLDHLVGACVGRPLRKFVLISSLGVYAARHHYGTTEDEPLPAHHVDGYTQSKVEAETRLIELAGETGVPYTILRPGFIYGPRDRTVLPNIARNLKRGVVKYIGDGSVILNTTNVHNLVDAVMLAIDSPRSDGTIFNITDGEAVTRRRFFETVCGNLGLPKPGGSLPMFVARGLAIGVERWARLLGWKDAPRVTRAKVKFLGLNLDFSIARARLVLGYDPKVSFEDGMREATDWYETATKGTP